MTSSMAKSMHSDYCGSKLPMKTPPVMKGGHDGHGPGPSKTPAGMADMMGSDRSTGRAMRKMTAGTGMPSSSATAKNPPMRGRSSKGGMKKSKKKM